MRCQDCGKELKEDAKFCIQCGYPVLKIETAATMESEPPRSSGKVSPHEDCR